ncbi:MAG: TonB-dependent receptor [Bacteroides sp.]|nr:TonB-dependent receptor [Bacteroides sp.]
MKFYEKQRGNCERSHAMLKKASFYACLSLFAGMALPMPLWASQTTAIVQQSAKQITGTVVDGTGTPVIGANVLQVGTTNGTITDTDGKFTLNVPAGAKLKISYIGYNDLVITIGGNNNYNITLKEDTEALDEVVVVGYGTQKKVNLTGSVATISAEKLANRTSANVTNMLAGQMPGVTVIQNTGQPGADAGVLRVRGLGTMGDASAMVVIDGVESTMSSVDPNDIENISILKDAAASAIYGVRAANGVILITTKKGSKGRAIVSYDGYVGWQSASRMPKYLDSYNYAVLMNEAYTNDGLKAPYDDTALGKFKDGSDPDYYPNSDWLGTLLSENGLFNNHHLSIKGGGDKVTYSLAFNYHDKDGLIENTNYNKFSVRANIDAQINKRLKLTTNMAVYRSNMTAPAAGISNLMHYAFRETPVTPIQLSNGYYTLFKNEHNSVAYAREGGTYKETRSNFQCNAGMELDIVDGLKLRGIAATTFNLTDNPTHTNTMTFYQAGSDTPVKQTTNSIKEYDIKSLELNLQAYLDYNKTFGKHTIGAMVGYSQIYKQTRYLQAYRKNLPNSNSLGQINAGEVTGQSTYGTEIEYALRSVFGRVNYAYDDRYLFEANLRYDGTSRFPKDNRFGAFPSFSIGWRISEEDFFKAKWVDNLKLRASWGLLGNQETVNSDGSSNYYPYQNTYAFGYDYNFGNQLTPGISISSPMANQAITWEKTDQWNVGADAAFFGNRLTFSADWFRKETRDILLQLPVPNTLGVSAPLQNAGVVRNTGIELQLGHNNRINKDWNYSVTANFSYVTTKIIDLKGGDTPGQSVGDPLWTYYGYVCDGIFQNEEEIKNHPTQTMGTPVPGDLKYRDLNGDKVIDSRDRQVLGFYFPKINFGLNLSLQYKDFDLSALLQGAADVKSAPVAEIRYAFYNGGKVTEQHLDRWTPDNPNASYPRLSMSDSKNRVTSSFWMQDASYAKLRNLQVGYSLPKQLISKYGISRLRVYCSIDNLFMISGFDGVDPEAISGNYYPLTRNYSFGVNVTF